MLSSQGIPARTCPAITILHPRPQQAQQLTPQDHVQQSDPAVYTLSTKMLPPPHPPARPNPPAIAHRISLHQNKFNEASTGVCGGAVHIRPVL